MFKISQQGQRWIMQLDLKMIETSHELGGTYYSWSGPDVDALAEELKNSPGARRMSYDTWWWTKKSELDQFLTHWYLKHG